jgi:hypothetical protein
MSSIVSGEIYKSISREIQQVLSTKDVQQQQQQNFFLQHFHVDNGTRGINHGDIGPSHGRWHRRPTLSLAIEAYRKGFNVKVIERRPSGESDGM